MRGLALEATGSIDEAIEAFQEVLALRRRRTRPREAGHAVSGTGQRQGRAQLSQQVVKAQPRSGARIFCMPRRSSRSGDLANAERELLALAKAAPSSAEVHTWMGMLLRGEARRTRGARRSFERALELQPESDVALAGLVSADLAEKNPAAALARIETQLAKNPNDPQARDDERDGLHRRCVTCRRPRRRIASCSSSTPTTSTPTAGLGAIYLSQNRLDEARKSFEDMAQRPGAPVAAETMLGTISVRQNKPDRGPKALRAGAPAQPARGGCREQPGVGLREQRRQPGHGAATRADREGGAAGQRVRHGYARVGLLQEGPAGLAVTTLKEAASQNASNPNIHYHLGLAYLEERQQG